MLSVKQGGIKYHFFKSFVWLDWTQVSRAIDEHSNHYANVWYVIVVQTHNDVTVQHANHNATGLDT